MNKTDVKVLIIDDQLSARDVLRGLLMEQGYNLAFADSGEEGLRKAAELVPDLVLLDVMMPGMDGFKVCKLLRANPRLSEVSVIMVTALDDLESRLKGLEAGADDFITKPFNKTELQTRVRTITRLNHQRRLDMLTLQAERDRTQAILDALGEAVVVTNAEGQIQFLNPAAIDLTGFTLAEAVGQNWQLWQSEETDTNLYDEILAVVKTNQKWRGEVVNKRKDGTLVDAALTVAPLFMPDSRQHIGYVSVQKDITPLKEAEHAKDEFVSNVSHELRTPLSVLTLASDNLDQLYDRLDDAQRRKMIRKIQKHTQILNEIISDVLDISRIDSRRVSLQREAVDLVQIAQAEVQELLPLASEKSQTLQQATSVEQLNVLGHPVQLRQVIRNLLNNAIKYTPDGGEIRCECALISDQLGVNGPRDETGWPESANLPGGPWAALRVGDTGLGISAEHLPHLFRRFYRAETQQKIRGTGLGLAIARKLIELHGGHIAVASVPNQGSTFAIYLPLLTETITQSGVK